MKALPTTRAQTRLTSRRSVLSSACAWPAVMLAGRNVLAKDAYPDRTVRLIVPQPAGSPVDAIARRLAAIVAPAFGVPVIVDNRAGASGTLGAAEVARAEADGYTLLVTAGEPLVASAAVMKLPYEPQRDFKLISKLAVSTSGSVLLASPGVRASKLRELVAEAAASDPQLTYASFGKASFPQLILESLARQSKVKLTEVPYKGSPPALQDLVAGHIALGLFSVQQAEPFIANGKVKALAIMARSARLPQVPTFAEAGFDAFIFGNRPWVGLASPAAMPATLVQRWADAARSCAADVGFRRFVTDSGLDPLGNSPQQFLEECRAEAHAIQRLLTELGIAT